MGLKFWPTTRTF
jgi:hypothetical protein